MQTMRWMIVAAVGFAFAAAARGQSESMRTVFCRENRFPELHRGEIGFFFDHRQIDEAPKTPLELSRKETTASLYGRFGVLPHLTAYTVFPYGFNSSERLDEDVNGFKDLRAGLELLAYEYAYGYPYIIPYFEVAFPTGNDDDGLGLGKMDAIFGTAVGTVVDDQYHYILDGSYDVNQEDDGTFQLAAAFIWEISDKFSVLGEAKITQKPDDSPWSGIPVYFNAGMSYKLAPELVLSWYGGSAVNHPEKGHGSAKLAYSF